MIEMKSVEEQGEEVEEVLNEISDIIDGMTMGQVLFIFGQLIAEQAETRKEANDMVAVLTSAVDYCYSEDETANILPI
jgi:predicted RNase H-like HicB family nuclease